MQLENCSFAHVTQNAREPEPNRISVTLFVILLALVLVATFRMVAPYLLAVLSGAIFANLSIRVFDRLVSSGFGRKWAGTIVTLAVFLLIVGPFSLLILLAVKQATAIGQSLSEQNLSFQSIFEELSRWPPLRSVIGDPANIERQLRAGLQSGLKMASGWIVLLAARLPITLLQAALSGLACFFFLLDGRTFLNWLKGRVPLDPVVQSELTRAFQDTTVSVIWATLAAAAAQAAVLVIGFIVLGVPGAFLAGAATFLFAWIPMLGTTPIWVAGAIYLYVQSAWLKLVLMLGVGLLAGIIDNFVRPLVLKGRSSIHPLVSLVAIFGGLELFGIMGVFFGPILITALTALLQIWPTVVRRSRGTLRDREITDEKFRKRAS
ncbi:MAG TPA: AI-2E family transporter [Bdellovibrionota bacterium]|nr:AI-2E family transporter [Bdellovibrionota bacterium]